MNELAMAIALFLSLLAITLYVYRHDIASFVRFHCIGTDMDRYDGMTPDEILRNADTRIEELIR